MIRNWSNENQSIALKKNRKSTKTTNRHNTRRTQGEQIYLWTTLPQNEYNRTGNLKSQCFQSTSLHVHLGIQLIDKNEFKTVIKSCEIYNACAAINDQPTVSTGTWYQY